MANFSDSDNKYKVLLVILLTVFVFSIVIGIVISTIDIEKKPEGPVASVINEGDLVISYNDGQQIQFNDNEKHVYSVSITNNGYSKIYYSIIIDECDAKNLNIVVKDKEDKIVTEKKGTSGKVLNLYAIEAHETIRYTIEFKNNTLFNVKGILRVINESLTTEMFSDIILLNNQIGVAKTRIGSEIATSKEGLIETQDNDGNSYYFRGNINNNYFKIGDLIFRIVRINGDNTVRVVLDDVIETKAPFNANQLAYGASSSSLALLGSASVINNLNEWYGASIGQYDQYITNGSFCSDTTFDLVNNNISYSDSYERIFNDEAPDLFCNGNIAKLKVGLLSVDEIVFAGASGNIPNTKYYLYNKKIEGNYLTSNSYSINTQNTLSIMNVMSNGALGDGVFVNEASYLRPVINIGTNAKIKGKGTIDNPYIIVS